MWIGYTVVTLVETKNRHGGVFACEHSLHPIDLCKSRRITNELYKCTPSNLIVIFF